MNQIFSVPSCDCKSIPLEALRFAVYASYMSLSSETPSYVDREKCVEMVANCASFHFRKASRSVTQLYDQILAPTGLRSTQLVILLAAELMGPCGLARLARELVMDRSTITRNLQPLVTQGFISVSGKSGRGGKAVEITVAGQKALTAAIPYWDEAQAHLLRHVGADRWGRVMSDLGSVVNATRTTG